jgi:uncharacterized protein
MPTYKTPGVYIEEISMRVPSVSEVETAIPAFIGYTQRAFESEENDLLLVPTTVTSMREFEQHFGDAGAKGATARITDVKGVLSLDRIDDPVEYYPLYFAMRMYFANGGGKCTVVSVGARPAKSGFAPNVSVLSSALDAVAEQDEPTLIVVPEAVLLSRSDYSTLASEILAQCGRLGDRFAIFDLYDGGNANADFGAARDCFDVTPDLKHGAVYYPFLRTALTYPYVETETRDENAVVTGVTSNVGVIVGDGDPVDVASLRTSNVAQYDFVKKALGNHHVTVPPSSAIAGIYVANDRAHGVWKAPANIGVADVIAPVVAADDRMQERLNVDSASGKSINVIRTFVERGTRVWGARTLAGNDTEWRYISVRRFFTTVEASVKRSTEWVVFEPNDANTWVKVRAMIENYLMTKWRDGALLGAKTTEAFFVHCGLGTTMTAQDILDGRLTVEVGMAVVRPAEYIVLRFSHKVQTA